MTRRSKSAGLFSPLTCGASLCWTAWYCPLNVSRACGEISVASAGGQKSRSCVITVLISGRHTTVTQQRCTLQMRDNGVRILMRGKCTEHTWWNSLLWMRNLSQWKRWKCTGMTQFVLWWSKGFGNFWILLLNPTNNASKYQGNVNAASVKCNNQSRTIEMEERHPSWSLFLLFRLCRSRR